MAAAQPTRINLMMKMCRGAFSKRLILVTITISLFMPLGLSPTAEAAQGHKVTLYRDEYGVPHIFAANIEAAAFAIGYAQAEDRLEDLLKDYRLATGTMAEAFGP